MSTYRKNFDETKYMTFFMKDNELLKNIIKFGERLKILLIKNLIERKILSLKKKTCQSILLTT